MRKENNGVLYTAVICLGLIGVILWVFYNAAFGKEEPKKQTEISVILYAAGTDGWESFHEGIKQAEDDFSVNINFVTLREGADAQEQMEVMMREVENGAEGLVIAVTDHEQLYEEMLREEELVPFISVESGFNELYPLISADNYEMGKLLGEEILKDFSGEEQLILALQDEEILRDSVAKRKEGLMAVLEGKAEFVNLEQAYYGESVCAVIGLHKESTLMLSEYADRFLDGIPCYGIGNTASIVAALDQRRIEKLVFQNEFNMGYLAVNSLLHEINGTSSDEAEVIDYYCVGYEELYGTQYEQLLFPIVE